MFDYIDFRSKKLNRLQLNIKPDIDFGIVLALLEDIQPDRDSDDIVHIRFALLELLNNSLRAHRSRGIDEHIKLQFSLVQQSSRLGLKIILEDCGRGFDPSDLPYNIYSPVEDVDLQSESFQFYRELHNQQRFGMGLFVTKKTFDRFKLEFIDFNNRRTEFHPDKVKGTKITLIQWGENNGK